MKNLETRVRVNRGLNKLLDGLKPDQVDSVLLSVKQQAERLKKYFATNKLGAMLGFYDMIDKVMKESNRENSCKRGCSFCCHINVDVTDPEAALIHHHCKVNNIHVDKAYLHARLHVPKMEVPLSKVSACVFLKNGECSIYEVRPLACRTYLVINEPEKCNAVKYPAPNNCTMVVNDYNVEIELSAFMNALKGKNQDRMERRLLNYFK